MRAVFSLAGLEKSVPLTIASLSLRKQARSQNRLCLGFLDSDLPPSPCKIYFLFHCVYNCVCVRVCTHVSADDLRSPEEGVRSPGARGIGGCELPNVGAGN